MYHRLPYLLVGVALLTITTITYSQTPQLVLPIGHSSSVYYAEFSPDGKYIVTASEDGTAKLWRVMDGKLLRELKGHTLWLDLAIFSPDGNRIATASNDNTFRIWETKSGRQIHLLRGLTGIDDLGNGGIQVHASFSPNGKYLATASGAEQDAGRIFIWDVLSGKKIRSFFVKDTYMLFPGFSKDGKYVLADTLAWELATGRPARNYQERPDMMVNYDSWEKKFKSGSGKYEATVVEDRVNNNNNRVLVKESGTGKMIGEMETRWQRINCVKFSPDDRLLVTAGDDGTTTIWETATGKLLRHITDHTNRVNEAAFSLDGQWIITDPSEADSISTAWNIRTATPVKSNDFLPYTIFTDIERDTGTGMIVSIRNDSTINEVRKKGKLSRVYADIASISPDGRYVVTAEGTWRKEAELWDAANGNLLYTLRGHTGVINSTLFSPDGKKILTSAFDDAAIIWDSRTGKILRRLPGHPFGTRSAKFSPDGKLIVTVAGDNTLRLWNSASGNLLGTFFTLDSNDHFMQVAGRYYYCTPGAARLLHYVTPDLDVISFEQLDVRYNRPDKVLEAIGSRDSLLVRAYRNAWFKRIRKLGIDTVSFREGYGVPVSLIRNRESITYEQGSGKLSLRFSSADSNYLLDRFNVWINEVPVFGAKGITIRGRSSRYFDTTLTLNLSAGENRIESSVINVNGIESYRMPLLVNYLTKGKKEGRIFFAGIGIDQYKDSSQNLQYSVKDIRDLARGFKEKYGDRLVVDTLFNKQVNREAVGDLKKRFYQLEENDKLVLVFSGHGLLSRDFDYYLSSWSIDFDHPETEGIPYDMLENLLDSVPPRQKLMLIDACHSGEVDKEDLVAINETADSMQLKKGLKPVAYKEDGHLGLANSFELMQRLFVNVGKSTGATVISAAAGTQFALEREDLSNGVFTYCILEAMKTNKEMTIAGLKQWVSKRVSQLTNGRQQPTSRNEPVAVDWNLW